MRAALVLAGILSLPGVLGDVYMHNPRGSNDRNCERNVNRNNGNRLFNSENNAKGGYACPRAVGGPETIRYVPPADNIFGNKLTGQQFWERMYYYTGSKLPIEWTAQHGCGGNKKTNCQIILQYACEDTLDPYLQFTAPLGSNDRWIGAPRDGIPTNSDDAATDTIDPSQGHADTETNRRFGMHENPNYYSNCTTRQRNRGLWTADQQINRNDARGTRQNPNGDRHGLECPEERDYYPYWHPSPWVDIAVLHDFMSVSTGVDPVATAWCNFYKFNSQNSPTSTPGECQPNITSTNAATVANLMNNGNWYNNRAACEANGHTFVIKRLGLNPGDPLLSAPWLTAPDCQLASYSRINHLGNSQDPVFQYPGDAVNFPGDLNSARYVWTIPNHLNENCAIRIRYNITPSDFQGWHYDSNNPTGTAADPIGEPGVNASYNGRKNSPVTQDPYIYIGKADDQFLSLKVNTNQYGRTFQDRSYVFAIRQPNTTYQAMQATHTIFNVNVRGKRGNIVQVYPAVEYDFVPDDLNVAVGDMIHWQWTGSDYNPRRGCNDATGGPPDPNTATATNDNSRADRSNVVPVDVFADNYPSQIMFKQHVSQVEDTPSARPNLNVSNSIFDTTDQLLLYTFIKQDTFLPPTSGCYTQKELDNLGNDQQRDNDPRNCGKLNAAFYPYFDGGIFIPHKVGTWPYFCSRNNNFSNRDQTGRVCVWSGADSSPCTGVVANPGDAGKVAKAFVPPAVVTNNIIVQDTFSFNLRENDALGDGVKMACAGLSYSMVSMDEGSVFGLAFGMIILGVGLVLGTQMGIRHYMGKPKSLNEMCFGGEGRASGGKSAGDVPPPPPPPYAGPARPVNSEGRVAPPPPPRRKPNADPYSDAVPLNTEDLNVLPGAIEPPPPPPVTERPAVPARGGRAPPPPPK